MIFLISDLTQYTFGIGKYSENKLRDMDLRIAIPDNFPELCNYDQKVGVIFFHTRFSLLSWIIMWITDSPLSHTAMLLPNQKVIHATSAGVIENDFDQLCDGRSYIGIKFIECGKNDVEKLDQFMTAQLGKAYNWFGAIILGLRCLFGIGQQFNYKHAVDIVITLICVVMLVN